MINLPFSKWTLRFHNLQYEKEYDQCQNEKRLLCIRILTMVVIFLGFLFVIVFLVQGQPIILPILMAIVSIIGLLFFFISKKITKYLKTLFAIIYLVLLIASIFVSYSGISIPLYAYGFSVSSCLTMILQYCDNRIKLFNLFVTPCIIIGFFGIYLSDNFQWSLVVLLCSLLLGFSSYFGEYNSRLAFSFRIFTKIQYDIFNEFTNNELFAISYDQELQQFQLEMKNKLFETNYSIKDSQDMREFLRRFMLKPETKSIRTKQNQINKTLEDHLYHLVCLNSEKIDEIQSSDIADCISKDPTIQSQFKAKIKFMEYFKPLIIITIQDKYLLTKKDKYQTNRHFENFQLRSLFGFNEILTNLFQIQQQLKQIQINNNSQYLQFFRYQILQTANSARNYQLYIQQDCLQNKKFNQIDYFRFNNYILSINTYFEILCQSIKKQFQLFNHMEQDFFALVNIKYLTQILFNLFDLIIKFGVQDQIILTIKKEININPKDQTKSQYDDQQQQLIKFTFGFVNNHVFQSQALNSQQSFLDTNDSDTSHRIVLILLSIIGPYNSLNIDSKLISTDINQEQQFVNEISFYIYSDQSQLGISYINSLKK